MLEGLRERTESRFDVILWSKTLMMIQVFLLSLAEEKMLVWVSLIKTGRASGGRKDSCQTGIVSDLHAGPASSPPLKTLPSRLITNHLQAKSRPVGVKSSEGRRSSAAQVSPA